MSPWSPLATDEDEYPDSEPTKFILDNDVDIWMLRTLQGFGVSVVPLPIRFRRAPDEDVLAEAKRQDRVLITHDRRFVNPRTVEPAKNPGIIIIPRDRHGFIDWNMLSVIVAHIYVSRFSVDQTVVRVYPSGRFTIWNPDSDTDTMDPIFCRVNDEREVEVWLNEDGSWGENPP